MFGWGPSCPLRKQEKLERDGSLPSEPRHEKTCLQGFPTRSDSNRPVQPQRLVRVLKSGLQKLETLCYLGSEQQRR